MDTKFLKPYQHRTIQAMKDKEIAYQVPFLKYSRGRTDIVTINKNDTSKRRLIAHTNMGILANEVGSGKSLVVLGLIAEKKRVTPYSPLGYYQDLCYDTFTQLPRDLTNLIASFANQYDIQALSYSHLKEYDCDILKNRFNTGTPTDIQIDSNLIIVPHSLFYQWKKEIEEHTNFRAKFISTKRDIDFTRDDVQAGYFNKFDVVLCGVTKLSEIYNSMYLQSLFIWENENDQYVWNRVFIDEVDTISQTYKHFPYIRSHFVWGITATCERLTDIPSKNNFFARNLQKLCKKVGFHKQTINAVKITIDFKNNENFTPATIKMTRKFHLFEDNFLYCFFRSLKQKCLNNCLNSDNLQGARNILTGLTSIEPTLEYFTQCSVKLPNYIVRRNQKNLILLYLSKLMLDFLKSQHRLRKKLQNGVHRRTCRHTIEQKNVLEFMKKIRDTFVYYQRLIVHNNLCVFCLSKSEGNKEINELNFLCKKCLKVTQYATFNFQYLYNLYNDVLEIPDISFMIKREREPREYWETAMLRDVHDLTPYQSQNSKIPFVIQNLKNNPGKRYLIFTNNYYLIGQIHHSFKNSGISYSTVKGNSRTIQKRLKQFQNNEIQVLLLNAKYFGSGLNLQCADEIYIFNKLDKETENQVIGRANRFGREKELIVNYVLYENEVVVLKPLLENKPGITFSKIIYNIQTNEYSTVGESK